MAQAKAVAEALLGKMMAAAPAEEIAAMFAEAVDFDIAGDTATVPWIGPRTGRAGVAQYFADMRAMTVVRDVSIFTIVGDDQTAAVLGRFVTEVVANGRLMESDFALVLNVADGLITRYRVLEDSFAVAEAVRAV